MPRLNMVLTDETHANAKAAAAFAGLSLAAWVERAVAERADQELADRAEAERRRRSR